jgi:hypothetical protein
LKINCILFHYCLIENSFDYCQIIFRTFFFDVFIFLSRFFTSPQRGNFGGEKKKVSKANLFIPTDCPCWGLFQIKKEKQFWNYTLLTYLEKILDYSHEITFLRIRNKWKKLICELFLICIGKLTCQKKCYNITVS